MSATAVWQVWLFEVHPDSRTSCAEGSVAEVNPRPTDEAWAPCPTTGINKFSLSSAHAYCYRGVCLWRFIRRNRITVTASNETPAQVANRHRRTRRTRTSRNEIYRRRRRWWRCCRLLLLPRWEIGAFAAADRRTIRRRIQRRASSEQWRRQRRLVRTHDSDCSRRPNNYSNRMRRNRRRSRLQIVADRVASCCRCRNNSCWDDCSAKQNIAKMTGP